MRRSLPPGTQFIGPDGEPWHVKTLVSDKYGLTLERSAPEDQLRSNPFRARERYEVQMIAHTHPALSTKLSTFFSLIDVEFGDDFKLPIAVGVASGHVRVHPYGAPYLRATLAPGRGVAYGGGIMTIGRVNTTPAGRGFESRFPDKPFFGKPAFVEEPVFMERDDEGYLRGAGTFHPHSYYLMPIDDPMRSQFPAPSPDEFTAYLRSHGVTVDNAKGVDPQAFHRFHPPVGRQVVNAPSVASYVGDWLRNVFGGD
jgi:hypothetical protein